MKKLILSLLLCVIALAQIQAQTKSQILDDIENTVRDFCAEINVLTEDPQSVQSDIEHISRNFASDEYFMYNGEKQQSFAKWLARYADIISGQEGVVHEFSLKETTLKRVDSNSQTDQRWYIKSELRRTVSNGNSLVEEIAFIVQWNGHERYVTILEMDGKWLRSVTRQTYSTEDEGIGSYLWLVMAVLFFAGACLAWVISKKRPSVSDSTTRSAGGNNLHATTHDKQTNTRSKKVDSQSKTNRQDDSSTSKAVSKTNTVFTGPVANSPSGTGATSATTLSQDDIDELYNWGSKYLNGWDVEKNYKKAVEYFTKAAEQGNANAQFNLGDLYKEGQGIEKDYEKAAYWYTKAAEQGNANAQFWLAFCYDFGEGVENDAKKAVYWYTKAAEQGHAHAQSHLAVSYDLGVGVEKDAKKAVYWYTKAAEQGNANAQFNLGDLYKEGQGIEKDYEKAAYWYTKAAEQGNANAQFWLAFCYDFGEGVENDAKKAVYWYTKAAEQGHAHAQFHLAFFYYNGEGVEKDYEKAAYWYNEAAEQGNANAQYWLAFCYDFGKGVEKDEYQAAVWYRKAASQGNKDAQEALDRLKQKGIWG